MKRLPIESAKSIAQKYNLRQVILCAWDGETTHIVTYGKSVEDCAQAATGGNILKQKWGWPECNDQPSRVKTLEQENALLRKRATQLLENADVLEVLKKFSVPVWSLTELTEIVSALNGLITR